MRWVENKLSGQQKLFVREKKRRWNLKLSNIHRSLQTDFLLRLWPVVLTVVLCTQFSLFNEAPANKIQLVKAQNLSSIYAVKMCRRSDQLTWEYILNRADTVGWCKHMRSWWELLIASISQYWYCYFLRFGKVRPRFPSTPYAPSHICIPFLWKNIA